MKEKNIFKINQNIYITNNEKIKEGDWFINLIAKEVLKCFRNSAIKSLGGKTINNNEKWLDNNKCKKIILTDNKDLIKDGLQAIDDEFLEWFVKNPSCESVEITSSQEFLGDDYRHGGEPTLIYKIIIPNEELKPYLDKSIFKNVSRLVNLSNKEETKQELLKQYPLTPDKCFKQEPKQQTYIKSETFVVGMGYTLEDGSTKFVTKQEILEEANWKFLGTKDDTFYNGAKWQAERMYSEEDLKEAFKVNYTPFSATNIGDFDKDWNKWFEQFKKK